MKTFALLRTLAALLFFQSAALASPKLSEEFTPDSPFKKNIYKGNHELSLDGGFGYSDFSGLILDMDLSYRYFWADKFSLGPIVGYNYSDTSKRAELGISGRWYFAEAGNWAFSLTQNIVYTTTRSSFSGLGVYRGEGIDGLTQLSANYFFNKSVYLGISLDYDYNITRSGNFCCNNSDLSSRVGIGVTF